MIWLLEFLYHHFNRIYPEKLIRNVKPKFNFHIRYSNYLNLDTNCSVRRTAVSGMNCSVDFDPEFNTEIKSPVHFDSDTEINSPGDFEID